MADTLPAFAPPDAEPLMDHELVEQVEAHTRKLSSLLDIAREVNANLSIDGVLQEILEKLNIVVDFTNATIVRLEGNRFIGVADYQRMRAGVFVPIRFPAGAW